MPEYTPEELDVFARAFERALRAAPADGDDPEEQKAILITGIMDAARQGVRDETTLANSALAALALYDAKKMDAARRLCSGSFAYAADQRAAGARLSRQDDLSRLTC